MDFQETKKIIQQEENIYDLASMIVDGTDARIPLKFIYPGTEKTVGVYIRPISSKELAIAARHKAEIFNHVLSLALYDNQKQPVPLQVIEKLPAGVVIELYKKIAEISGIPTSPDGNNDELLEQFLGF